MASFDTGHHAAELLAWLWAGHRSPAFLRYVEASYASAVSDLPTFQGVVLSEAAAGNVEHGWVQSIATRWWVADGEGFRPVPYEALPPWWGEHNEAADAGRLYYRWPRVHFFIDGDRLVFSERLGPGLRCVKAGRVADRDGHPALIDVRLLRTGGGGWKLRGPVAGGLEVGRDGPRMLADLR
jgi:hypothetical protein